MKKIILTLVIGAAVLTACNENKKEQAEHTDHTSEMKMDEPSTSSPEAVVNNSIAKEVLNGYLHVKNALTDDNSKEAVNGGTHILTSLKNIDTSKLTSEQLKTFNVLAKNIQEHADLITKNGNNIEIQREHFELLSKDMYDLLKALGAGQTLYVNYCPMYNNNKGGSWLSETKEIKNPYYGKEMLTCGEVKEEMKP